MRSYESKLTVRKTPRLTNVNSGFTLIELIVVVVTMALLFGLGFANYRGFQKRQYFQAVSRMLKTDLRLAQSYALSGRKEATCINGIDGYIFRRISATSYQIEADCLVVADSIIKTTNLSPGIQISSFSYTSDNDVTVVSDFIKFKLLGRGTNMMSGVLTTITLTYPGSGLADLTVIVSSTGDIK